MKSLRQLCVTLLILSISLFCKGQHPLSLKNNCISPSLPPYFLPLDANTIPSSRSGNNYSIPFDTVIYNPLLGNKALDIVICIDGAINNTQIEEADNYVDSFVAHLQNVAHYSPRFKYFNIYRVAKLSNEQGAAWGFSDDTTVTNRYGSRFNAYGLPRLLLPEKHDTLFADVTEFVPHFDLVLLLVYDKKYGGSGISYYDGRKVACFSIEQETGWHLGDEVIIHEMQHVMPFAGHGYLGDEYEDSLACMIYDTIPESPNVTSDTLNQRKWQHCMGLLSVGFYQEAGICVGNYRPTPVCAMRQVYNFPDFCPVCRENSTAWLDSMINPVYYSTPLPLTFDGIYTFRALVDTPIINTFLYQWFLDDSLVAANTDSLLFNFDFPGGTQTHILKFVCTDIDPHIIDTTLRRPWITEWIVPTTDSSVSVLETLEDELLLFPNPVTNRLNCKFPLGLRITQVEITASDGTIMIKSTSNSEGKLHIDLSLIPSGTYFITVEIDEKRLSTKFVKL